MVTSTTIGGFDDDQFHAANSSCVRCHFLTGFPEIVQEFMVIVETLKGPKIGFSVKMFIHVCNLMFEHILEMIGIFIHHHGYYDGLV